MPSFRCSPLLPRSLACAALLLSPVCWGQAPPASSQPHHQSNAQIRLTYERVRLPGDERMGLLGTSYLVEAAPGWWVGPAAYGALTGDRGGLFTVGLEGAWRRTLMGPLGVEAGVYVGGGGGASAPVGGGLMLRPHAGLMWDFGGWRAGLSYSRVRFPDGDIDSSQWSLVWSIDTHFNRLNADADRTSARSHRSGMGFDRMLGVAAVYRPAAGTQLRGGGAMPSQRIGMVGMRMESFFNPWVYGGIEAAGAASGGVGGYAEYLATLGVETPLAGSDRASIGARLGVGMAGGGDVSTGGGLLLKAAVHAGWRLSDDLSLALEGGWVHAPDGDFRAPFAALNIVWALDHRGVHRSGLTDSVTRTDWVAGVEQYRAARRDGAERTMRNVVLKVNRFIAPSIYLTGQARSAYDGGAGGFTAGLVGVGWHGARGNRLSAGAEMVVGAGGGGGVDSGGGALVEPNAFVAWQINPAWSLRAGAGYIWSSNRRLSSPMAELSIGYAFGVQGRP